ncbi:MAG: hypothetical protein A2V67_11040 [Deltaproteobacteria bacterium RBG_13_61_14]|nr:MAG: hypothetical protein A2V67_11040 [Deltaproteobacteria bacterium RBG_13_61_14]
MAKPERAATNLLPRGTAHRVSPYLYLAAVLWGLSLLLTDCAPRRVAPVIPPEELSAERVVDYLSRRGGTLEALEARVELQSFGLSQPAPKLVGGLRILRQEDELHLEVQAYLPLGAPAFDLIAQGPRYQLFLPSEKRYYANSPDLFFGRVPAEVVTEETATYGFPTELFYDQLGLIFGQLPLSGAEYQLVQTREQLILEEYREGALLRRIFLDPRSLYFQGLEAGEARVEFSPGPRRRPDAFAWIPRQITLLQQGVGFQLTLSQLQVNPPARPAILFREPGDFKLYLIEPKPPLP